MPSRRHFPPSLFDSFVAECLYGSENRNQLGIPGRNLGEVEMAPAKCCHICGAVGIVRTFHLGIVCFREEFPGTDGKGISHLK